MEKKKCQRCHNTDPSLFGQDFGIVYCKKCIEFGRLEVGQQVYGMKTRPKVMDVKPVLSFELTKEQQEASQLILKTYQEHKDTLVFAAAGAGKTELVLESISYALSVGHKVGFAISRRQVVLEIVKRLQENFPQIKVIPVCEGYTSIVDGDLIVCTTHQLYRYADCFDLLILDELDAFPYAGNEVLETIAQRSCKGNQILLSATPDKKSLERVKKGEVRLVELFKRPHGKPLCIPRIIMTSYIGSILYSFFLLKRLVKRQKKQILFYVPRKRDGWWMKSWISFFYKAQWIHSGSKGKDEIMDRFREGELEVLVCTTLLERGITVPSVQVIVWHGDHTVFTMASLIQIFGRIGRSIKDPSGEGYCICFRKSKEVDQCIQQLKWMNKSAYGV